MYVCCQIRFMTGFTIRPARIEDAVFLGKCVCEGIGFRIFEEETDQNREIAANIAPLAARERTLYSYRNALVVEVEGEVAGAFISYPGEYYHEWRKETFRDYPYFKDLDMDVMPDEAGPGEYYIDTVAVLPQFRRRGIGGGLMKERIAQVQREHPDLRITLLVDPDNLDGQRIYSRLGFHVIDHNVIAFNHLYWKMEMRCLRD